MSLPEAVARWVDVFQGSLDLERYLDLFSQDVEFRDGESGQFVRGKKELTELIRPFTQLSEMSATVLGYAVNDNQAFLEGELRAKAPSGESVITRGVGIFIVTGSKISKCTMYMFRQNISL